MPELHQCRHAIIDVANIASIEKNCAGTSRAYPFLISLTSGRTYQSRCVPESYQVIFDQQEEERAAAIAARKAQLTEELAQG